MKKAVIIGGKGKVGTYLVPMLCAAGYSVQNVSRGIGKPYVEDACWNEVEQVSLNRDDDGFERRIAALGADVVVDMICFREDQLQRMADVLEGAIGHYLVCGSVWMHGKSTVVPYTEEMDREPFDEYGIQKHRMDLLIQRLYAAKRFPGTIVHPGHIVGVGHIPINPQGNQNLEVFSALRHGEEVVLPNQGMETLNHVHACDVAGVFMAALQAGGVSFGQGFHATAGRAVTLTGYAEEVARWYGRRANLRYQPFEEWKIGRDEKDVALTADHINRSPNASMEKARRLLGFTPRYTSFQAVRESLDWLVANGKVR
jgi:nucleoside-diphosphate-sugar epimerase